MNGAKLILSASRIYPSNFVPSPCHRFIKLIEDKGKVRHLLQFKQHTIHFQSRLYNVMSAFTGNLYTTSLDRNPRLIVCELDRTIRRTSIRSRPRQAFDVSCSVMVPSKLLPAFFVGSKSPAVRSNLKFFQVASHNAKHVLSELSHRKSKLNKRRKLRRRARKMSGRKMVILMTSSL